MSVVIKRPWFFVKIAAGCIAAAAFVLLLPGCKPEELGAGHPTTVDFYDKDDVPPKAEPRMFVADKNAKPEDVIAKSKGCVTCHSGIDLDLVAEGSKPPENPNYSMHLTNVGLGCTDCRSILR